MIRALHLSDSHFCERLRLPDVIEIHRVMLERARELRVNLILHGGDFFHARSTPAERTALAEWLQAAAEIAPVFGVRGNHDAPGDLDVFRRLRTKHPVIIEERVTQEAHVLTLDEGDRVGLLGMAWVEKAHFVSGMEAADDQQATTNAVIEGMRQVLSCLRAEANRVRDEGAVPILATHVMIGGSVVSSGQVMIGQGVELSPSDLADVGAVYVACGHVHCTQEFHAGRVAYSGSPVRHNLGEPEGKGFRFVRIENGEARHDFIELPARRIVLIEADWTGGDRQIRYETDGLPGALVRVRYRISAEKLHEVDEAHIREQLLADGAHEVKLEAIVEQETRVRSELIVEARDTWSKVEAWLVAMGLHPDKVAIDSGPLIRLSIDPASREGSPLDRATLERLRAKLAAIEAGLAREVAA